MCWELLALMGRMGRPTKLCFSHKKKLGRAFQKNPRALKKAKTTSKQRQTPTTRQDSSADHRKKKKEAAPTQRSSSSTITKKEDNNLKAERSTTSNNFSISLMIETSMLCNLSCCPFHCIKRKSHCFCWTTRRNVGSRIEQRRQQKIALVEVAQVFNQDPMGKKWSEMAVQLDA